MHVSLLPSKRRAPLGLVVSGLAAGSLLLSACERAAVSSPEPLHAGDIRNYVTEQLAERIGPDGGFQLPAPLPGARPQITPQRAAELALAYARSFAPYIRGYLEGDHGREIDFDALRVGSPAYYAATAYEPVPDDAHPGVRNAYGPYYLVYLSSPDGTPVLSVAVAAYTEAWIENGHLWLPPRSGADVFAVGVPRGQGFTMPLSPEQAVRRVGELTGSRAAAVPELLLADRDFHPQHARWKVTLDRPVQVLSRANGQARLAREIYVGLRGSLTVPAATQPTEVTVFDSPERGMIRVTISPERPVAFEPITPANP
ncbi:MAG TPA: hypothetical protein VGR37_18480 [Longimicrobiaceae bacterium]|nr:hypothetical protein [Longimicrobiaceae bacterium]